MRILRALSLAVLFVLGASSLSQATYTQQYTLASDATFQGQVLVAMLQSCANAMSELATVSGHPQRMSLCIQILQNPPKWQPVYAFVLASQSNNPMTPLTVPSTVADTLVQTASDAQLTNIAGYYKQ